MRVGVVSCRQITMMRAASQLLLLFVVLSATEYRSELCCPGLLELALLPSHRSAQRSSNVGGGRLFDEEGERLRLWPGRNSSWTFGSGDQIAGTAGTGTSCGATSKRKRTSPDVWL